MARFRFEELEIWQRAIVIASRLCDIADGLVDQKSFRFAEQLRGAALSISNNIAEGAGSTSNRDFANFLNIAKRSCFENANMVILFETRGIIDHRLAAEILDELEVESRMIANFRKSLLK